LVVLVRKAVSSTVGRKVHEVDVAVGLFNQSVAKWDLTTYYRFYSL
jgi:hypothetical protein